MTNELDKQVLSRAQAWLDGDYDEATKAEVRLLMETNHNELVESFYKDLEFGTGGLRGIMGVGTNRMNIYTVGSATQGLANYLKRNFAGSPSVLPTSSPRTALSSTCSMLCAPHPSLALQFVSSAASRVLWLRHRTTPRSITATRHIGTMALR